MEEEKKIDSLDLKDLCITCGEEVRYTLWGKGCKPDHTSVHQSMCDHCNRICGIICDDDYSFPEILLCPDCMDKIREKKK